MIKNELNKKREELFDNIGYIKLSDYVDDIRRMQKYGPWKLPLSFFDKGQLFIFSILLKISWFSNVLYIKYFYRCSPAYSIILIFLKKNKILSSVNFFRLNLGYYRSFFTNDTIFGIKLKGSGVSCCSKEEAFSKGIGELLERSVSGFFDENKDIIIGSYLDIVKKNRKLFYPPKYHKFLDIQKEKFNYLNSDEKTVFEWVKGFDSINNEVVLIPKHITSWFFKFDNNKKNAKYLQHPTSNGSAGYFNLETSIRNSILEVIQRDSFMVHWLTKIPPDIILLESLPKYLLDKIIDIKSLNFEVILLDITTNIPIPSICVVLKIKNSNSKQVMVSASSGVSYEKAILSAIEESLMCIHYFNLGFGIENNIIFEKFIPFLDNLDKKGRIAFWGSEEVIKEFNWFLLGKKTSYHDLSKNDLNLNYSEIKKDGLVKAELNCIKIILNKLGEEYHPYVYVPKSKITNKLGFFVSQVFIPKCFPLYLVEHFGTFKSVRLNDFAKFKNVKEWKLNTYPHPFP